MKLSEIKEKLLREEWVLPPFQREYVWNEENRLIGFIESIFRDWPIGSIIIWVPNQEFHENIKKRKLQISSKEKPKYQYAQDYIIDGQQRITTLMRILNNDSFIFGEKEKKMSFNFRDGKFFFVEEKNALPKNILLLGDIIDTPHSEIKKMLDLEDIPSDVDIDELITNLKKIGNYDITIQKSRALSLKDAQELFIRLNTGGKQLPSVDLALAYISLLWDESREEFKKFKEELKPTGFFFDLDFFVRCLSAISLSQSLTKKLIRSFETVPVKENWEITKGGINKTIDFLKSNLNLGSNLFLDAENTLVPIVLLFSKRESAIEGKMDLLTYWFTVAYINQRFSGQSTSTLNKDIKTILESETPIEDLIQNLKEDRSIFLTEPKDIKGNQFKFIFYCLYKRLKTKDFVSGFGLDSVAASKINKLDFHHIFANALLKKSKFKNKKEEIANKTFLTNRSNKKLSDSSPTYLEQYPQEL
ncbi:DUF262 domain-containing protein, partial [Patescibacteria group bacterium]|nr:DUF262 domain-containing protein [Patescibacteria group bacterium]